MIFGINTSSDISKLLCVISRAVTCVKFLRQFWNITSGIYPKYHVQIMLLFVYTTTPKQFVIFTCRYLKLSRNTTALSQSNCRNFSFSSIIDRKGTPFVCYSILWRHHFRTLCPFPPSFWTPATLVSHPRWPNLIRSEHFIIQLVY